MIKNSGQRYAITLSLMQALGGANPVIVFTLSGLAGQQLAPSADLATVPISLYSLGLALGTLPAGMIMRRIGRQAGYLVGAVLGISAGLIAAFGIYHGLFAILCLGTAFAGLYAAYVQSYRFAAADHASDAFRPKAISWVMAGGLLGAIIGTQAIIQTRNLMPATPFVASFLAQAGLAALVIPIVLLLLRRASTASTRATSRASTTSTAPARAASTAQVSSDGTTSIAAKGNHLTGGGRPLKQIARNPKFIVAVLAGVVSYGVMNFIMTASPLAMIGCGHTLKDSTLGIQWHVLAMYGPSFFTGSLITRYGKIPVTIAGVLLLGLAGAIALTGISVTHFWFALIFLGLGWNLGFIGATAMVTDCYRPEEKSRVQSFNDFLVFGCVAVASFSSGHVLAVHGWTAVTLLIYPALAVVLLALLWLGWHSRRYGTSA